MLWLWFVLPLLARKLPIFFKLTADVTTAEIYVCLISVDLHGGVWFRGLALPILGETCVLMFLLSYLLRDHRHTVISTITFCIGGVGLFLMCVILPGSFFPGPLENRLVVGSAGGLRGPHHSPADHPPCSRPVGGGPPPLQPVICPLLRTKTASGYLRHRYQKKAAALLS